MSEPSQDDTTSPGPRRSQRDKKVVKPFVSVPTGSATGKRKRADSDTERDVPSQSTREEDADGGDASDADDADNDDDEDEGYHAPKGKATPSTGGSTRKGKAKASPKAKPAAATAAKKPRTEKAIATAPKPPKGTSRRGRKPKDVTADGVMYDAEQVARDTKVAGDNPLFNAIVNPASALQASAEAFLQSLQQSPELALAELINLVLRACGCNDSVDPDQAVDADGIVSTLDDFTEVLKQENSPVYPLTSKLPVFKRFRKSLSEWIERLIVLAADLGLLYTSQLMQTLQPWVVTMSSSQIRSFRHTATVVALEAESALCDVAVSIEKEAEVVDRQRDGEKKRKGIKGVNPRLKELDKKAKEVKERKTQVSSFIKEFFDGVFVHRYRDLDPSIRAECIRAMGVWLDKYPKHFLSSQHLLYIGWLLSDVNTQVRLEAVRAVSKIYDQEEYIATVNHFTQHFKARLVKMATSDTELSIRVAVIQVLSAMEGHRLLEEEEREQLCLLLFDDDAKVRKAVSPFVQSEWDDQVTEVLERLEKSTEKDKERIKIKVLASFLVNWSRLLDERVGDEDDSENGEDGGGSSQRRKKEVLGLIGVEQKGRMALAVDALWDDIETIRDWKAILDLLQLDHSAVDDESRPARSKANGRSKQTKEDMSAWRLEEVEESTLLEVLVSSLRHAKHQAATAKKGDDENVSNEITDALIEGTQRLFIKYQTDQKRIADVLLLPTLMNLDVIVISRQKPAFLTLWDEVTKQFILHFSVPVLSHAMAAIQHFLSASSLKAENDTKLGELEDALAKQLRDLVAGRDEIEVASFSEDEVLGLGAFCTRLTVLFGARDMTAWMEEDEKGKQSSAWNIIIALVERGRLGYKEEETMVEKALHVLALHIFWKTKGLISRTESTPEVAKYKELFREQRENLLERLVEYGVGTQSNTVDGVKRAALRHLIDLHILFLPRAPVDGGEASEQAPNPLAEFALTLDDELQYRCAGFLQAEIERFAEFMDEEEEAEASEEEDDDDDVEGEAVEGGQVKKAKGKPVKKTLKESGLSQREILEKEYLFMDVVATFLRGIRVGAIHLKHGYIALAQYGRLNVPFDTCAKVVVDCLREEQVMKENPGLLVSMVTQAVQEAYSLVLDGFVRGSDNAVALAKVLSSCFIVRGSQLAVLRRLDTEYIIQIQTNLLSWIIGKIAAYEKNKNKKGLKLAIGFFKVLVPLIGPIPTRDALKIKAQMDQLFEDSKIEIPSTSKQWEPYRAYEKRLSAIMSKDKPHGTRGRKKKADKAGLSGASSGDETEGEKTGNELEAQPTRPKPRPKRATRANPIIADEEPKGTPASASAAVEPIPEPKTPQRRRATSTPLSDVPLDVDEEDAEKTPTRASVAASAPVSTPLSTKRNKRPRGDEDAADGDALPNGGTSGHDSDVAGTPDIKVKRKRVRH